MLSLVLRFRQSGGQSGAMVNKALSVKAGGLHSILGADKEK